MGTMLTSPPLVLVAEDNEDIRELVSHQLRRMGVRVVVAEDGRRAVDVALAERPGLVLMDMDMPVMSGFDAVAALRAQGYAGPIFALTAYRMVRKRSVRCRADATPCLENRSIVSACAAT